MAEKKSKTDVTARDKSGRTVERRCDHCGGEIGTDRDMVVVMDGRRANKTYYRRECWQKLLSSNGEVQAHRSGSCPNQ